MLLELKDEKKEVIGTIELTEENLKELKESLGSDNASALADTDEVAQLREQLAEMEVKTIDDYPAEDKASFVVPWLSLLDDDGLAILSAHTGLAITRVAEAEEVVIEETETEPKEEVEVVPKIPEGANPDDYAFSKVLNGYIHMKRGE